MKSIAPVTLEFNGRAVDVYYNPIAGRYPGYLVRLTGYNGPLIGRAIRGVKYRSHWLAKTDGDITPGSIRDVDGFISREQAAIYMLRIKGYLDADLVTGFDELDVRFRTEDGRLYATHMEREVSVPLPENSSIISSAGRQAYRTAVELLREKVA